KASDISSPPCLLRLLPAGAVAGWDLHPLESAAFTRLTPEADLRPATRRHQIRAVGGVAARQRRNGEALWRSRRAGSLSCPDEMEPGLVQRTAQLCHRSYP